MRVMTLLNRVASLQLCHGHRSRFSLPLAEAGSHHPQHVCIWLSGTPIVGIIGSTRSMLEALKKRALAEGGRSGSKGPPAAEEVQWGPNGPTGPGPAAYRGEQSTVRSCWRLGPTAEQPPPPLRRTLVSHIARCQRRTACAAYGIPNTGPASPSRRPTSSAP